MDLTNRLAGTARQEALRVLVTGFPGLELFAEPTPRHSYQFRGYTALHVAAAPSRNP